MLSPHGRCSALPGARCPPGRSPSPTVPLEGRGRFGLGAVSPVKLRGEAQMQFLPTTDVAVYLSIFGAIIWTTHPACKRRNYRNARKPCSVSEKPHATSVS
ncbi:hypothetical protein AV530_005582 [Patagioenas fasciata monilis]|uniref:Uncharacterized protein n=1 Tax=Patagioenas fasciata monilis TaxID=372326 RepID=A0A1V4JLX3_PATFA|nr:hypothetical protein AV530_005582 [Patagioenas fasciata monilis]